MITKIIEILNRRYYIRDFRLANNCLFQQWRTLADDHVEFALRVSDQYQVTSSV
jgi:hypothetical protein